MRSAQPGAAPADLARIGTATLISRELDDRQQYLRRVVLDPARLRRLLRALRTKAAEASDDAPPRRLLDRTPPAQPRAVLLAESVAPTAAAHLGAAATALVDRGWQLTVVTRTSTAEWAPPGTPVRRVPDALELVDGAPATDVLLTADPTAVASAVRSRLAPVAFLAGVAAPDPAADTADLVIPARALPAATGRAERPAGAKPRHLVIGDEGDPSHRTAEAIAAVEAAGAELLWAAPTAPRQPRGRVYVAPDADRLAALAATADVVVWPRARQDADLLTVAGAGCAIVDLDGAPVALPAADADADLDDLLRPLVARSVAPNGSGWRHHDLPGGGFDAEWMRDALDATLAQTAATAVQIPVVWEAFEGHRMATWMTVAERDGAAHATIERRWLPWPADTEPPLRHGDATGAFRAGDPAGALRTLVSLHNEADDEAAKATMARWIVPCLLELGQDDEAFRVASDAMAAFPDHLDFAYLLGATAPAVGLRELAVRALDAVRILGEAAHRDEFFVFDDDTTGVPDEVEPPAVMRGMLPDVVPVTILTPAIPERLELLAECLHAVAAQTVKPVEHLVVVDTNHAGPGPTFDRLLSMARTEWVAFMADDDLPDPRHLEVLWAAVEADPTLDVVYSWCRTEGKYGFDLYNQPFDPAKLVRESIVAGTALFRRELGLAVGGFRAEFGEDWRFWQRLHTAGAKFLAVPEITWTYRFHGQNHSKGDLG